MAYTAINPRQIWLTTMGANSINGNYACKNESAFSSPPTLTSVGSARIARHPNATFNGQTSTPIFIHSAISNIGAAAHFPIYSSEVTWFDPSTGGPKASSTYASNFIFNTGIPEFTSFDWLEILNPQIVAPPTSLSVDYSQNATPYTSQNASMQLRNHSPANNQGVMGYGNPYSMGSAFTIQGVNLIFRLSIKTVNQPNTLAYVFSFGVSGGSMSNSEYYVNTSTFKLTSMKKSQPIYQNSTTPRSDIVRFTKIT